MKHFANEFGPLPRMRVRQIGIGCGKKDFEQANCVRAFLGESEGELEKSVKLECNVDDMTAEELSFAMDRLFEAGARDVYTQAAGMKKSRAGTLLSVVGAREDADTLAAAVMKYTTTLGIRRFDIGRYVLQREIRTVDTELGPVRVKYARGMGVEKSKAEYDDCAAIAREKGMTVEEVRRVVAKADGKTSAFGADVVQSE